jgi:hypothetical protein
MILESARKFDFCFRHGCVKDQYWAFVFHFEHLVGLVNKFCELFTRKVLHLHVEKD